MPRILVVDDEPSIILAVKDEMAFEGFEVDSAADGPSGLRRARESRPDVLLVALGAPRQDVWIARNLSRLNIHAAMGVGGSFDMISGRLTRCPAVAGRLGLEWAL